MDGTLTWKSHIEMTVPKLSAACFTIRVVKPYMTYDILIIKPTRCTNFSNLFLE